MASTYGTIFRVTTFGESHGVAIGATVDGCPPRIAISEAEIQAELDRRRPGQSRIVTQRKEADRVEILSCVLDGQTLGTPIALVVRNEDHRSKDYDEMRDKYRPSHADYAYDQKYGIRAWSGGGRASARETIGRVAAGALAKKILATQGVEIVAYVESVGNILASIDTNRVTMADVESNIVRCPDQDAAERMMTLIESIRKDGDSIGGVIGCVARNVPAGWGEPIFDKLEADLAKAMLSIPACKGFEVGGGFGLTSRRGSEVNDLFEADENGDVSTRTNFSGGINGGISNGMPITLRLAFKPTATVLFSQDTVTTTHENTTLQGRGRHDPCVLPRAVPIVESMMALTLVDHYLRQRALMGIG